MSLSISHHPTERRSVVIPGIIAAVAAAAATSVASFLLHAAGVSFVALNDPHHKPIPPLGFAVLTVGFLLVGVVLAFILARTMAHPHRPFLIVTIVLFVLSLVPDFTDLAAVWPTETKFALAFTHLLAAGIVIPTLARRLNP